MVNSLLFNVVRSFPHLRLGSKHRSGFFNLCNNTPLQLTASFWKLFKILSYKILEAKFRYSTQTLVELDFLFACGRDVNFMEM